MRGQTGRWFAVLTFVCVAALLQTTQAAADQPHEVDVHFEEMTVEVGDDILRFDYSVAADDWMKLHDIGIPPRIDLTIPVDGHDDTVLAEDIELTRASDRLEFSVHPLLEQTRTVRLEPVAGYHSCDSGDLHLGGDFAQKFEFRLDDGPAIYRRSDRRREMSGTATTDYADEHLRDAAPGCDQCGSDSDDRESLAEFDDTDDTDDTGNTGDDDQSGLDDFEDADTGDDQTTLDDYEDADTGDDQATLGDFEDGETDDGQATLDDFEDVETEDDEQRRTTRERAAIVEACGDAARRSDARELCTRRALQMAIGDGIETVDRCEAAASRDSHLADCLDHAADFETSPQHTVEACEDATTRNSHFQECLQLSADYAGSPSLLVDTCDEATTRNSHFQTCLDEGTQFDSDPHEVVRACEDATTRNSHFQSCLQLTSDYETAPAEVVDQCDTATTRNSHFQECLDYGANIEVGTAATVEACDDATTRNSHFQACLEATGGYGDDVTPLVDSCEEAARSSDVADCIGDGLR